MAKGKKVRKPNHAPNRRTVPKRRRQPAPAKLGTILHKGIRSILSVLPGSSLTTKAADLIFRSLGWSDNLISSSGQVTADVRFTGLTTTFRITPSALMCDCANASTTVNETTPNDEWRSITTNYQLSRVVHFKVTASNAGPSSAHGQWIMAFWPFQSVSVEDMLPFSVNECRAAPFYVEGPSSKTLTLKYYVPASNLYLRGFGTHLRTVGVVTIVYLETNRSRYEQLTPADFDPNIELKFLSSHRRIYTHFILCRRL